ncbi:MAG: hypothetical protein NVSMB29_00760 [Candidatus Dormibacteria bacterium]
MPAVVAARRGPSMAGTGNERATRQRAGAPGGTIADRMVTSRLVLVVEDNDDVREMLRLQLGFAGYEVLCAEDGMKAIELLERFDPEVMLVDVVMPRLDGVGLTEHVRAQPRFQEVPLILLTGLDSSDERVRKAMALPHVHHLAKGQSPASLLTTIEELIRSTPGAV